MIFENIGYYSDKITEHISDLEIINDKNIYVIDTPIFIIKRRNNLIKRKNWEKRRSNEIRNLKIKRRSWEKRRSNEITLRIN